MSRLCTPSATLLLILLFSLFAVGQPAIFASVEASTTSWSYAYGGVDYDNGYSVATCSAGGFITAGYTQSFSQSYIDLWVVRITEAGQVLWHQSYGGQEWDEDTWSPWTQGATGWFSIIQCQAGGFAITGQTPYEPGLWDYGGPRNDLWLVRLDETGTMLWNQTYGGIGEDWGNGVIECSDGGFLAAGMTRSFDFHEGELLLIRYDQNGQEMWHRYYGGPHKDSAYSLVECQEGGFAVVGYTKQSTQAEPADCWLLRVDQDGAMLWNRTYGGLGDDQGFSIVECEEGGFAIAGYTEIGDDRQMWILRTDASGTPLWENTFGGPDVDQGHAIIKYSAGGFVLAGFSLSNGPGTADVFVVGVSESGELQWSRIYGGPQDDFAFSLVESSNAELVIAGSTKSYGAGDADLWVIRVPPNSPQPTMYNVLGQLLASAAILATIIVLVIAFALVYRKKKYAASL
ncbi:MAG: hypothetical protein ACFFCO_04940 [Promethearchaeota archaeon]